MLQWQLFGVVRCPFYISTSSKVQLLNHSIYYINYFYKYVVIIKQNLYTLLDSVKCDSIFPTQR